MSQSHSVEPLPDVSRETSGKDFPQAGRRRRPRSVIERNGRVLRNGPAWSDAEIATLRRLVDAGCTTKDIAAHFQASPLAVSQLMHRNRITRRHPTVAEVLQSSTPAAGGSESVREPAHQASEMAGGGSTPAADAIPVVTLLDRFEKYVGMVELHEVYNGMARIRHIAGTHGHAGKWLTVPVLQLHFDRNQDRTALIEQAKQRATATQARRAALHQPSPNNGEPDNA